MKSITRAFAVALVSVGLGLTIPAAGYAAPRHCQTMFTVNTAKRAAQAVYAGTRHVRRRERLRLGGIQRCQRNPAAIPYVRWFYSTQRAAWIARLYPAPVQVGPASSLAACIVQRESGGNPQAVNGQYTGAAQWSPSSWLGGGGGRFAPTPLGATFSEQMIILNAMLANGQAGQWTPFDGC